jgi:xanthine/CO dehydrogenase XdhC/CoxF family maturation factor
VLARLVARNGPGSRPLGATIAVATDGTWRGSVSGGCVESNDIGAARSVFNGAARVLYGVTADVPTGSYLVDDRITLPSADATDPGNQHRIASLLATAAR